MDREIRLLKAEEIECRAASVSERGVSLLLFKDARVDQKILDETFTPFGWRRKHQSIDGNLYCTVEIWDEDKKQWIGKQDVGTMSYSEREKGQASDSFKRACFNWGIGRELYTAPFIWIAASKVTIQKKGEKYSTSERFSVQEITYNKNREIISLVIVNSHQVPVYTLKEHKEKPLRKELVKELTEIEITALEKELERTGVLLEAVLERYHLQSLSQMTMETYDVAMNSLKKSKTKEAA